MSEDVRTYGLLIKDNTIAQNINVSKDEIIQNPGYGKEVR